ncbi:hypothetical protein [Bradyrhizobium diazoefficiens]|uniref:hypothetical protein n=1 Tax=Bradyrhizobium diazoefficiens TaxID=1355477 RepID=UPI003474C6A2
MNAPAPIKILTACAEKYALCCALGEMEIQWSVDMLQNYAEQRGLVVELGQDKVQDVIAAAFIWARAFSAADEAATEDASSDYAARLVRDWEMADSRDAWRWTGAPRPPAAPETKQAGVYKPAASTVEAFFYVVRLGDPAYLAAWLASHPTDAPHLIRLYEAKYADVA